MVNIPIPENIAAVMSALSAAGFESYIVGGCVRDFLLGSAPHDIDITTSATVEEMRAAFVGFHTIDTGVKHGTLTVMSGSEPVEVTTFRIDGKYSDGRHPDSVIFTRNLTEDLARRDFTVNAIAYSPLTGICDPFGGAEDLKRRVIRTVGSPERRFSEDYLRIMRGVRFASCLGFSIEEETAKAIHSMRHELDNVARERIFSELKKLLCGQNAKGVLMEYADILAVIIPEIADSFAFEQHSPYHCYDVYTHTIYALDAAPKDIVVRLSILLHDIAKPACCHIDSRGRGHFKGHPARGAEMAAEILKRLRADSDTIEQVSEIIRLHEFSHSPKEESLLLLGRLGLPLFLRLIEVQKADNKAKQPFCIERVRELETAEKTAIAATESGECVNIAGLEIDGNDMIALGLRGKEIGEMLNFLLRAVVYKEVKNDKNALRSCAQSRIPLT